MRAPSNTARGLGAAAALVAGLVGLSAGEASAQTLTGRASVVDGDTLEIQGQRVRLWGVDAVESSQSCGTVGACGRKAAFALQNLVGQRPVSCSQKDTDRYGRVVAVCSVSGQDLGAYMVAQGWARDYTRYSGGAYKREEAAAAAARRGAHAGTFQSPAEYRKERR
jgi:endonuclease YncB( thermonuclease family)